MEVKVMFVRLGSTDANIREACGAIAELIKQGFKIEASFSCNTIGTESVLLVKRSEDSKP